MNTKKATPKKVSSKKGLSDEEFIKKYEAGKVDLTAIVSKGLPKIKSNKSSAKDKG